MRNLIIVVLILALGGVIYYYNRPTKVVQTPGTINAPAGRPDPSNATFEFEEASITLTSGRSESAIAPGSALKEETSIVADKLAYGDVNFDDKEDTALLLVQSGGGSGVFLYVAGYVSTLGAHKGTNAVFVGDRISPQSLKVSNGQIILTYLDREEDEPFAAEPTVSVTKTYIFKSGRLQEK